MKLETLLLHDDESVLMSKDDVTPPITMTTTYRVQKGGEPNYVYSRENQPIRAKVEKILGDLEQGHAVTYSTGMAAIFAAFAHVVPKRVIIAPGGYFVTHRVIQMFTKFNGMEKLPIDTPPQKGDLIWLETPKNPACDIQDVAEFCRKAHAVGATVVVDATFAPPPVQYTLRLGPDMVMHSTTKYLSGHSDALGGVLISNKQTAEELLEERTTMGNTPGNLESWLLLRSLRTLTLRVRQQCENAFKVATWLELPENAQWVSKVYYPGLPSHPGHAVAKKQMHLFGGMLSIELKDETMARALPQKLKLFRDATSLGGVESLIDWRYKWDKTVSPRLLRVSIGLEHHEDLQQDFAQAFGSMGSSAKL